MIETLKHQLADQMERLAIDLLGTCPTTRTRDEIRFGRKSALAVRVAGPKRGTFCDYRSDAKGDAIALICHVRNCSTGEAICWGQAWLGDAPRLAIKPASTSPPATPERSSWALDLGRNLWREAVPPQGTLAEAYAHYRGLALEPGMPIRFHPHAWRNKKNGPPGPAMLALMTSPETGEPSGIHLTYLRSGGAGKAEGPSPKIMLGPPGIIRLSPDDAVTTALGLAEGIETALSVMQYFRWRPVWAACSAGGIARFPVLSGIESITVFADQDTAGAEAAQACARRWKDAGREARILAPPQGDFNDLAREVTA